MSNEPLKIGETRTLKNGQLVKCIETDYSIVDFGCSLCQLNNIDCDIKGFECLSMNRPDKTFVHFELVQPVKHALGLPESDYDRNKRLLQQAGAYNEESKPLFSDGLLNDNGKKLFNIK